MLKNIDKCVVIAPHPDDETLGLGGSIARMSSLGIDVSILIVSGHLPPLYDAQAFEKTVSEAKEAFKILGVNKYEFLKIPATFLIKEDISTLYNKIVSLIILNLILFFFHFQIDILTIESYLMVGLLLVGLGKIGSQKLSYSMKHYQKHIGMFQELSQVLILIFLLIFLTLLIKKLRACLDTNHKLLVIPLDLSIQLGLLQNLEEVKMVVIMLKHSN